MNISTLEYAITNLDENLLAPIIEKRFACYQPETVFKSFHARRAAIALASTAIIGSCAFAVAAPLLSDEPAGSPGTEIPDISNDSNVFEYTENATGENTESGDRSSGAAQPDESSESSGTEQYIAAFSTPTLEELYDIDPFSYLMPRYIPESLHLSSSYLTEKDKYADKEGHSYLSLIFKSDNSLLYLLTGTHLEISVSKIDDNSDYHYVIDPGNFTVNDVNYVEIDNFYDFNIGIRCGDRILEYSCRCFDGDLIPEEELFKMITSSKWFTDQMYDHQ